MNLNEIIVVLALLSIPAMFMWVVVSSFFEPDNAASLRGERRKVMYENEEFEFRFWTNEYGWHCCGVFAPRPPKKVLWKYVNDDYCINSTHSVVDPVKWCYSTLQEFYTDRALIRAGEAKLKEWLANHPEV